MKEDDDDLFDVCRNRHGGNEYSDAAFHSIKGNISRQRIKILGYMTKLPRGATCDEAQYELGMLHQACSARFTELKRDGLIIPLLDPETKKQTKRKTKAGRYAGVWVAVQ